MFFVSTSSIEQRVPDSDLKNLLSFSLANMFFLPLVAVLTMGAKSLHRAPGKLKYRSGEDTSHINAGKNDAVLLARRIVD